MENLRIQKINSYRHLFMQIYKDVNIKCSIFLNYIVFDRLQTFSSFYIV